MKEAFEKIIERLEEQKSDWNYDYNVPINDAIDIVNQVAEEYNQSLTNINQSLTNDGWIPCSERLPEEKENPITKDWFVYPVMARFGETTDIRYYSFGNDHWHHGPTIMDKYVTHWMDIKPYQPKEPNNE